MSATKKKLTRAQLAEVYGMSLPSLDRARAAGVDIYDARAVETHRRNQTNPGKPAGEGSPDLEAARLRKVDLDCEFLQIKIDRERGILVERELVDGVLLKLGHHSKQSWDRIADELPPSLEGLTAAQMKTKLLDYARARQVDLSEGEGLDE